MLFGGEINPFRVCLVTVGKDLCYALVPYNSYFFSHSVFAQCMYVVYFIWENK